MSGEPRSFHPKCYEETSYTIKFTNLEPNTFDEKLKGEDYDVD